MKQIRNLSRVWIPSATLCILLTFRNLILIQVSKYLTSSTMYQTRGETGNNSDKPMVPAFKHFIL